MLLCIYFCFQAEDGIRYLVRSRGLGDVYKRQPEQVSLPGQCSPAALACHLGHRAAEVEVDMVRTLSLIHI